MNNHVEIRQLRSFGLIVGSAFALIGLWPLLLRSEPLRLWSVTLAALLALPALALPWSLAPVYRAWMKLGHLLGLINTRILLSLIFFCMITPLGLIRRLLGKDTVQRQFDPQAESYRVARQPRPKSHMHRQF